MWSWVLGPGSQRLGRAQVSPTVGLRGQRGIHHRRGRECTTGVLGGGCRGNGGGTEGSFVRQEAAETKYVSLDADLEERSEGIKKRRRGPNKWKRWRTRFKERSKVKSTSQS